MPQLVVRYSTLTTAFAQALRRTLVCVARAEPTRMATTTSGNARRPRPAWRWRIAMTTPAVYATRRSSFLKACAPNISSLRDTSVARAPTTSARPRLAALHRSLQRPRLQQLPQDLVCPSAPKCILATTLRAVHTTPPSQSAGHARAMVQEGTTTGFAELSKPSSRCTSVMTASASAASRLTR